MWRRIVRIPFENVVPEDRRDPTLKPRLKDPDECGRAILAWIVEGAIRWAQEGLIIPECIRQATDDYRAEQDPLGSFFSDCCTFERDASVSAADLRKAYERHCEEERVRYPLGPQQFGERLRKRGCMSDVRKIEGKSVRLWEGLHLIS
jgi:putative DNA primase/helicase